MAKARRIQGKQQPLATAGVHALRDEYNRAIEPVRALAAETFTLERTLSGLVHQAYALIPAEIELMWQTAPPRMLITRPSAIGFERFYPKRQFSLNRAALSPCKAQKTEFLSGGASTKAVELRHDRERGQGQVPSCQKMKLCPNARDCLRQST